MKKKETKKTFYSERLPFLLPAGTKTRCQFMHTNGSRCAKPATIECMVFQDPAHYHGERNNWMCVDLCEKHARRVESDYEIDALLEKEATQDD